MSVRIHAAHEGEGVALIRALFTEYQQFLGFSLCFQGFEDELNGLPGLYAPPQGALLLALPEGMTLPQAASDPERVLGCVGLRPTREPLVAELKRLYVRPAAQGQGVGSRLLDAALEQAQKAGYREVWLDSLKRLEKAEQLYRARGFTEMTPYNHTPIEDVYYMKKKLAVAD